jgi:NADH-quinone oxidoreductase subunit L
MRFYTGAMLLLVCHAFYKALLFLTAGNVLHGLNDEMDMRRMGGLAKEMPLSAVWFAIGALSLAGIPPLAGFFAKDQIVGFAATSDRALAWTLASIGAFLSALYIARPLFLTFFGRKRTEAHAHEAPPLMQAPLAVLAFLTVVGGLVLGLTAEGSRLATFLVPVVGTIEHGVSGPSDAVLMAISIGLAVAAVAVAYWVWASGRVNWEAFPERQPELAGWLGNAFYLNQLYAWLVDVPGTGFGRALAIVDERVIDGAVNEVAEEVGEASRVAPRIQRGFVRSYALAFLLGAVALLLFLAVRA